MQFIVAVFAMFALQASAQPLLSSYAEGKEFACNGDVYFGLQWVGGEKECTHHNPLNGDCQIWNGMQFQPMKQTDHIMKRIKGSIECSVDAFGEDPQPGFQKQCFCEETPDPVANKAGLVSSSSDYKSCDAQGRFNIMMCNSFMCTKSTLDWAMKACQKTQANFPTCRCEDWPKARLSYSGGDFAGKGRSGDAGDYAKAASAFLSTEIETDA